MNAKTLLLRARNTLLGDPYRFVHLTLELNSDCNRNCTWCPLSQRKRRTLVHLNPYPIIKELQRMRFLGSICWAWLNEPLLDPGFLTVLRNAHLCLPYSRFQILTNGDYMNGQLAEMLDYAWIVDISVHARPLSLWLNEWHNLPPYKQARVFVVVCTPETLQARCGEVSTPRPVRESCNLWETAMVSADGYMPMCCNDLDYERTPEYHVPTIGLMAAWRNRAASRKVIREWTNRPDMCRRCTAGAALTIKANEFAAIVARHGWQTADSPVWQQSLRDGSITWRRNAGTENE